MSEVLALRRSARMLWVTSEGDVLAVHSPQELVAHVSAWRVFGGVATVHGGPVGGRIVGVTALGDDGWVVKVRDKSTAIGGWPCSRTFVKLLSDGSFPTPLGDSPWYIPDESTDLAGTVFLAEQVQFNPVVVAQAAWEWLIHGTLAHGYTIGMVGYEPMAFANGDEALSWIADTVGPPWPTEAARATVELAEDLDVDRVIVTTPSQIALRAAGSARRVLVLWRPSSKNGQVRVVGMIDELGHEYSMGLPGREILRISRRRVDR